MRLKSGIVFSYILFLSTTLFGQVKLSKKAEILVLTLGPTQTELYSAFGHSAIRVYDPVNKINRIYNYGVFDFDQPNFYLNFTRGHLNYKLDTIDYPRFRYAYIYYNRYIHEQILNFTQEEKQKFYDFLEWNMLPENQYYYYDYFYDNCATRVRDALEKVFPNRITFDGSYITTNYTIRDLTDVYLPQQPWGEIGIDLCLGMPMDVKATPYMYMYLPDYIESGFNHATINRNGEEVPLVSRTISTYESKPQKTESSLFTPKVVFWSFFILILGFSSYQYTRKVNSKWLDVPLFILFGALGTLLLTLWVATNHNAAANNLNVFWALPTHFFAGIFLLKKAYPSWLLKYFLAAGIFVLVVVIFWGILPQHMHSAFLPIALGLSVRSFLIWKTYS